MKSPNCISATGRKPRSDAPTLTPMMHDSEIGMSRQRYSPNSSCRPFVIPKAPPYAPTSSPSTNPELDEALADLLTTDY